LSRAKALNFEGEQGEMTMRDLVIKLKADVYWLKMAVLGLYPLVLTLLGIKILG